MPEKRKRRGDHEEGGHSDSERWMISYADMLTLLLALFIVMFAISKVDQKKFQEFSHGAAQYFGEATMALNGTEGVLDGQPPTANSTPTPTISIKKPPDAANEALAREKARKASARVEMENLARVRDRIRSELAAKGLKDAVEFRLDERGLVVNIITDKVLFDTGRADLRPDGVRVLDVIAPSVRTLANRVTIEGHTDNVPITSGSFVSNWELSTARATTVLRRLVAAGLPSARVSAAGYADQRPSGSNRSSAGRARNRRVAVVVLPRVLPDAALLATSATPAMTATAAPVTVAPHSGA
ncbi:MAG TPA: flagellar motor protein MotB [Dermatophilaceae bacterium]|nr:flagellar motor protein MotB [Dermatophilaceae bacterium]